MSLLDEDFQAWDAYPQHRWVFNKLEVALKLGYRAGPACVPLPKTKNTLFLVKLVTNGLISFVQLAVRL